MSAHLSGIIPVANCETELGLSFPELLLPIGEGLNLIQKSVYECAAAGCNTIWIVANDDLAPVIRKTVGDWVYDPVYYKRDIESKFYTNLRREVPIYYVGIKPKDRNRRDSYGWSILEGIHAAYMTSYKISKWLAPEKYFISFPFGVFDIYFIRQHRKLISDKQKNIFFTYNKKSIIDNQFLPFTMTGEDFKTCRRRVNKKTTREYLPPLPDHQYPSQKLPLQDRWSARQFSFSEIFEDLRAIDHHDISLDWYHDVSTWDNYVGFISSDNNIIKPFEGLTRPHRHVKIPYTSGE
jgi:hypothetical protein|tara:strand:- start:2337 stop:3218 length:882 start_codon:yes stop_codon:yes gene_type:complete